LNIEPGILIAEDEDRLRRLLSILLNDKGYRLSLAANGAEALQMFRAAPYDLVITDIRMPEMDGIALLTEIKKASPDTPVIVITAFGSIESAVEAMRAGAIDYITKPFEEEKIHLAIDRALKIREILDENRILRQEIREKYNLEQMIAESQQMADVLQISRQVATSNSTVLIMGESGTGKELITRAIHEFSPRAHGPFIAINCAAIPEHLLESELFGHEKGAFTGATDRKIGKFEAASGGTLFLDEIGEMSLQIQAKVLRAIEQQEIGRVGGTKNIKTNIRFIAATNRDLRQLARDGKFREDLFFRINVFPIFVPPLRERTADILPLARFFVQKFAREMGKKISSISPEAEKLLLHNRWDGNVRELQNVIERATIMLHGPELTTSAISGAMQAGLPASAETGREFIIPGTGFSLEQHERNLLVQALERTSSNKSRAAKLLGISRATLRYRLEKFGLESNTEND
jgi:DNA-binding NtrC family response regulator